MSWTALKLCPDPGLDVLLSTSAIPTLEDVDQTPPVYMKVIDTMVAPRACSCLPTRSGSMESRCECFTDYLPTGDLDSGAACAVVNRCVDQPPVCGFNSTCTFVSSQQYNCTCDPGSFSLMNQTNCSCRLLLCNYVVLAPFSCTLGSDSRL